MHYLNRYFFTLKTLFSEPRQVIDSFLKTDQSPFLHPFLFCVTGAAAVILLNTLLLNFSIDPMLDEIESDSETLGQLTEWLQIVSARAATQFLPLSLVIIFIISLSVGGMFFLRTKTEGFFDFIIINAYSVGASIPVLPLLIPVWGFSGLPLTNPVVNSNIPGLVVAGVILWIYNLYFRPTGFLDWIKSISGYVTGFVIYVLLSGLSASVIAYVAFAIERISRISG